MGTRPSSTCKSCGLSYPLACAKPGELVSKDAPRLWEVATEHVVVHSSAAGGEIELAQGVRLRYDQRDYDDVWRLEADDRFHVLDGAHAGTCVFVYVPMPGYPVDPGLRPVI